MSIFPHTNHARHTHHPATENRSLFAGVVTAIALAWFAIDLAMRLKGYPEPYWMADLDILAVLVLVVGAAILALRVHAQKADQAAAKYEQQRRHHPQSLRFHVSDGGIGLPPQDSRQNTSTANKTAPTFDGGAFPTTKQK
jgi:uncharacterized membrane protein